MKGRTRVIACGNPLLGNDAAGLRVMALLQGLRPGLDMVEGGLGGLGLIPLMEGADRVIIVDATQGMGEPGEVRVFRDLPPSRLFPLSLHDLGVVEAVQVAREVGIAPEVVIVGIEGGAPGAYSRDLDPEVERGVQEACRQVLALVDEGAGNEDLSPSRDG
ncbi:MAG: hydrogenase maturation protease [Methanomicrobiales archaeon]|nr:hydrogenase maturation protease [Methanomicrobiales archaeon]